MAVCRVDHDHVGLSLRKRADALHRIIRHADPGGHPQAPFVVLGGIRIGLHFRDVLVSQQADQTAPGVHHRQLLDLVLQQDIGSGLKVGIMRRDQILLGHHLLDAARHVALETQVAVGHDTDQHAFRRNDRNAADAILLHQLQRVADRIVLAYGDRIVDHAVLGALHLADLGRLLGDRHILVNHPDTPGTSDGDRHFGLGHRIHGRRSDRRVDLNVAGKAGGDANFARQHFGVGGDQKYVIESQAFGLNFIFKERHGFGILKFGQN